MQVVRATFSSFGGLIVAHFYLIQNKGREWPEVFNYGFKYIFTYIIGHYNPSVRIIYLVSHTTYVMCVNFYT